MSFNLKDFIKKEINQILENANSPYDAAFFDEQQEAYELADTTIIFVIKALNGTLINDIKSTPYIIYCYTPEMRDPKSEDAIILTMNYITQFIAKYSSKTIVDGLDTVTMVYSTPSVQETNIANSFQFRSLMYFTSTIQISSNQVALKQVTINDVDVGASNLTISYQNGTMTTTNARDNKQKIVSKSNNYITSISLTILPKFSSVWAKLKAQREGKYDANAIYGIKFVWNDGSEEQYTMICTNQQFTINRLTNERTMMAVFTNAEV